MVVLLYFKNLSKLDDSYSVRDGSVSNNHFLLILLFVLLLHFSFQCIFLDFCSVPAFHSNLHKYACHCYRRWFGGNKRCFKCTELISEHSRERWAKQSQVQAGRSWHAHHISPTQCLLLTYFSSVYKWILLFIQILAS